MALLASFAALVVLVSGEAMARSRAGLGLTIVALVGVGALVYSYRRTASRADRRSRFGATPAKLFLGATTLAIIFTLQFSLYRIMERFADDPLQDGRITLGRVTIEAAKAYMPFGSGTGSFVPVYAMHEKPQDAMADRYVNQAHDDYLQVWLETGVVGIVLIGSFVIWLVFRSVEIWRRAPPDAREIDLCLARAATLMVGLLMAHSVVDYPLRTGAMMAIMAFACALLVDPVSGAESELRAESDGAGDRRRQTLETAPAVTPRARSRPSPVPSGAAAPVGIEGIEWPQEWRTPPKR
jgi:O-antigen ligase